MSPMEKSSIKKLSKTQTCSLNPHTIPTKYPITLTFMVNIKLIKQTSQSLYLKILLLPKD